MERRRFSNPSQSGQTPVCTRSELCVGCQFPANGFICWGDDGECMKTRINKLKKLADLPRLNMISETYLFSDVEGFYQKLLSAKWSAVQIEGRLVGKIEFMFAAETTPLWKASSNEVSMGKEERKMKAKRFLAFLLAAVMLLCLTACVDQHPEETQAANDGEAPRLIATSPAVAQICARLGLDLVGVCDTSSTLPEMYQDLPKVGMAMNPDLEIIKSLTPDYVLSPSTLKSDLQPKYAGASVGSLFLDLKSVEGMHASIEGLGKKFGCEEEAQVLLDEFDAFMEEFHNATEGKEAPNVLVLLGLPGSYIVATESSYVGSLVKLAGGVNVYGDGNGEEFLTANTEDMKLKEPDIILQAAHALPDDVVAMFEEEFTTNDIWKHFRAVQDGRVYDLDPSLFNMSANFNYPDALSVLQELLYGE